jgi:hypothetical protein
MIPLAGACSVDRRVRQPLRIKQFYGTSESAVKTQIWIAISVYILVAAAFQPGPGFSIEPFKPPSRSDTDI